MGILLRPERLIDGTGAAPFESSAVLVENGKITAIEQGDIDGNHQIIELPGHTLLPGLIDTHVHLTVGQSPWKMEDFLASTPEEQLLVAVENGRRALESGVTTVRDCGGRKELLITLRDFIRAGQVKGPRILTAGPPVTTTAGHMWYFGLEADSEEELRKSVRQLAKDGVDYIKIAASGGGMTPGSNPRAPQYSVSELKTIVKEATRLGLSATAHCLATESVERAASAGLPMIEHANFFSSSEQVGSIGFVVADGFDYRPDIVDSIVVQDIPISQAITGWHRKLYHSADQFEPEVRSVIESERETRCRHLQDMRHRGIRFLAGSDGMVDIPREYFATLEITSKDIGLSNLETIAHATSWAASALGIGNETGTIEVGKVADLVAVSGDPSREIMDLRKTALVCSDGEIVLDKRNLAA